MEAPTRHATVRTPPSVCSERVHTPRGCFELTGAFRVGFQVGGAEFPKGTTGWAPDQPRRRENGVLRRGAGRLGLSLGFRTCSPGGVALARD